jgi:hypothetical protein
MVLLNCKNLPARRFPFSKDINDLLRFLISPYEDPSPHSKKGDAEQEDGYAHKPCDDANDKPCP